MQFHFIDSSWRPLDLWVPSLLFCTLPSAWEYPVWMTAMSFCALWPVGSSVRRIKRGGERSRYHFPSSLSVLLSQAVSQDRRSLLFSDRLFYALFLFPDSDNLSPWAFWLGVMAALLLPALGPCTVLCGLPEACLHFVIRFFVNKHSLKNLPQCVSSVSCCPPD